MSNDSMMLLKGKWVWTADRKPNARRYVLVVRESTYTTTPLEFLTGQFDGDYKGWTDPSNTRLSDSGNDPFMWFDGPLPVLPATPTRMNKDQQFDYEFATVVHESPAAGLIYFFGMVERFKVPKNERYEDAIKRFVASKLTKGTLAEYFNG